MKKRMLEEREQQRKEAQLLQAKKKSEQAQVASQKQITDFITDEQGNHISVLPVAAPEPKKLSEK